MVQEKNIIVENPFLLVLSTFPQKIEKMNQPTSFRGDRREPLWSISLKESIIFLVLSIFPKNMEKRTLKQNNIVETEKYKGL